MPQTLTIDWLSFTIKEPEYARQFYARNICPDKETPTAPRFGYTSGYASENGILRFASVANPRMGTHYVFSGSTLAALYNAEVSPFAILADALACRAKVTRLDLAKDVTGEGVQLEEVWQAIQAGHYQGTSQAHSRVQSDGGGYTIYIGSRVSEKFIRLYDKGAEVKSGQDWKRCELELKGDTAKTVSRALTGRVEGAGAIFDALARQMFDCSCRAWKSFRGDTVPVAVPKVEKQTDRETWIELQVLPAVLDHLRANPGSQAAYSLYRALDAQFRA